MELNLEEALRYAGVPSPPPEALRREMEDVAAGLTAAVTPPWRWRAVGRGDPPGQPQARRPQPARQGCPCPSPGRRPWSAA